MPLLGGRANRPEQLTTSVADRRKESPSHALPTLCLVGCLATTGMSSCLPTGTSPLAFAVS